MHRSNRGIRVLVHFNQVDAAKCGGELVLDATLPSKQLCFYLMGCPGDLLGAHWLFHQQRQRADQCHRDRCGCAGGCSARRAGED